MSFEENPTNEHSMLPHTFNKSNLHFLIRQFVLLVVVLFASRLIYLIFVPTATFTQGSIIRVSRGESLMHVSEELKKNNIIASIPLFQFFVVLNGGDRSIVAGDYYFGSAQPVYTVAKHMVEGNFAITATKVTIPEGFTNSEIGQTFDKLFPYFDLTAFDELTKGKEGYLFPDTYFVSPYSDAVFLTSTLENTFTKKISTLAEAIASSGHTEKDIITMASIIEREARGDDDRDVISGILWHRIAIGMPLQVDATLGYVTKKTSSELTLTDLASDSLYNTYTHIGLPPGPIANPGMLAIKAALVPSASPYLFYLHDNDGVIHYAKTFDEHKTNKAKYLN